MSDGTPNGGRPTDYRPEYCALLIDHMSKGLSFESFAGTVRVSRATIYDWLKANAEFLDAKEIGTTQSMKFWEELGVHNILNESESFGNNQGSKSKSLNSSAWIFNMKNRFGWRDKHPDENGPAAIINNNNLTVTDEQLQKLIKTARGEG